MNHTEEMIQKKKTRHTHTRSGYKKRNDRLYYYVDRPLKTLSMRSFSFTSETYENYLPVDRRKFVCALENENDE